MGLIPRVSVAAIEIMPINNYMNSTDVMTMLSDLEPCQPTDDLEFHKSSGTDKLLNIFGIPVTIEIDEGAIIVTDDEIHMYGIGNTLQEAIDDYKLCIALYLEELEESEERLGANLKQHLHYLRNLRDRIAHPK